MLFFSIMFLVVYIYLFFQRGVGIRDFVKAMELSIKEKEGKTVTEKETNQVLVGMVKGFVFVFGLIILGIVELIFITKAIKVDIYMYPSLIMLLFAIYSLIKNIATSKKPKLLDKSSKQLSVDDMKFEVRKLKEKIGKRTFVGTLRSLIRILYYAYMITILIPK